MARKVASLMVLALVAAMVVYVRGLPLSDETVALASGLGLAAFLAVAWVAAEWVVDDRG